MCTSESFSYSTLGMTRLATILSNDVGGGEVKVRGGGELPVCPNCRQVARSQPSPPPCCPVPRAVVPPSWTGFLALLQLKETIRELDLCGWYYRDVDWQGAQQLLQNASPGAFLVRNSRASNFYFSLSVQTSRGPTSVRLHYANGLFRLDCEPPLERLMPAFRSVVELVQHYTQTRQSSTVWMDSAGCPHSPVLLRAGLRAAPPRLAHAARLALHRALDKAADRLAPRLSTAPPFRRLPLPPVLLDYLAEYPYTC